MAIQVEKRKRKIRPRVPLSLQDLGPEPVAEAYSKMMGKFPNTLAYSAYAKEVSKRGISEGEALEIACGPGFLLAVLAQRFPKLTLHGLDISPNMLKLAEKNLKKKGLDEKIELHLGSAYDLPFEDNAFDLIINTSTLHHLEDPEQFFKEALRVLKPSGTGIIFAYRRDSFELARCMAYLQSRYLAWRKIPLDGLGPVIDASYTAEEIEGYLGQCCQAKWHIKKSPVRMTILLQK